MKNFLNIQRCSIILTLSIGLLLPTTAIQASENAAKPHPYDSFIETMKQKHEFKPEVLDKIFANYKPQQRILDLIQRPYEAKPWHQYRPIFVTKKRAKLGLEFWKKNEAVLKRAEEVYGVPSEIIVAIIGVETYYGKNTGSFPVLTALATLAFEYPPRSKFFSKELEHFLLLAQEEQLDYQEIRGSYAGAMGRPQFMPSSYRHYSVDFNNDGKRDLFNNNEDVIGSVAAYFKQHGWKTGEPVAVTASVDGNKFKDVVTRKLRPPKKKVSELNQLQITPKEIVEPNRKALLLEFEHQDHFEYWLGFQNFYVITRYNHSSHYARAVYELSQMILSLKKASS